MTAQFATERRDTPIEVNAADPGHAAADLDNRQGMRGVEPGARTAVRPAALPADGPTGGFCDQEGALQPR